MTFEEFQQRYEAEMAAAVAALDDRWGAKGYRAHETMNGVAFVLTLTDGGREVAWVEDAGNGGGPQVSWKDKADAEPFREEARRLFPSSSIAEEDMVEAILRRRQA